MSSPHTVKGFTDDLSVFSSSISEHHSLLSDLSTYSQNLISHSDPVSVISVIFDGNKMNYKTTFSLANGSTRNITAAPTKILGKLIAGSFSLTKLTAGTKLDSKIISAIQRLDDRPIRGEFKSMDMEKLSCSLTPLHVDG